MSKQCQLCGHPSHLTSQCSVGQNKFYPTIDGVYHQRNCMCPEDVGGNDI